MEEVRRLPLWRSCLDRMEPIEYGRSYKAEFFEKELSRSRDTMAFDLEVSRIREELEKRGFYLSGRGQNGTGYTILAPEENADVMVGKLRCAMKEMRRAVSLGVATPLERLTPDQRKRHLEVLERSQNRLALMRRSQSISKRLFRDTPKELGS